MNLSLVPLCTANLQVGDIRHLDTPSGRRMIGEVTTSRWEGERLRATQVGSGADWLSYHDDDMATVDVRVALRTDDDAFVTVRYAGRSDLRTGLITTSVWFETGDADYRWLNRLLAAGRGAFDRAASQVTYDITELR